MGDVINLRRMRKARQKAEEKAQAARNRARHGRTRAEREAEATRDDLAARRLDGHRLDEAGRPGDDGAGA